MQKQLKHLSKEEQLGGMYVAHPTIKPYSKTSISIAGGTRTWLDRYTCETE